MKRILALTLAIGIPSWVGAQSDHTVTRSMVDRWMSELSNWGRWGKGDERGTLNLVTPDRRRKALSIVRDGFSVSLSHDYIKERAEDATSPFVHEILGLETRQFVSDRDTVAYHGYTHSHMDAICHDSADGKLYNGHERALAVTAAGCAKLGINNFKQGIIARGVLVDVPSLKGVAYLEPGAAVYADDLEAWEKRANFRIGPGDVMLVRTGRWARRTEKGAWATSRGSAGLHASVLPWLKARDVAMIGSDYANDVLPSRVDGVSLPIHQVALVAMGMPLFDNLDLETVAKEAASRRRWVFLVVAAPLAVENGTGSPLN